MKKKRFALLSLVLVLATLLSLCLAGCEDVMFNTKEDEDAREGRRANIRTAAQSDLKNGVSYRDSMLALVEEV